MLISGVRWGRETHCHMASKTNGMKTFQFVIMMEIRTSALGGSLVVVVVFVLFFPSLNEKGLLF